MVNRGKQTCKILKDIRKQIAEANDIEYITSECQYKGECVGSCPKCETEVSNLMQALERRRLAGKVVSLVGISIGLLATSMLAWEKMENAVSVQENVVQVSEKFLRGDTTIVVKGRVVDQEGKPLSGADVREKGTGNGTVCNQNGYFTLYVSGKRSLVVSFIGCKTKKVRLSKKVKLSDLLIVLKEDTVLIGEMPVSEI